MNVTITWQTIITIGSVITAIALLISYLTKVVHFFDEQKKQSEQIGLMEKEIKRLRESRQEAVNAIRDYHDADMKQIREEQQLLIYCNLACLKGLQQLGANGEVTKTIDEIEKHLNQMAHNR